MQKAPSVVFFFYSKASRSNSVAIGVQHRYQLSTSLAKAHAPVLSCVHRPRCELPQVPVCPCSHYPVKLQPAITRITASPNKLLQPINGASLTDMMELFARTQGVTLLEIMRLCFTFCLFGRDGAARNKN